MLLWQALVLAIIQGLTEFIPVSSSGHLVLAQTLMGLPNPDSNLTFDLFLHLSSCAATIVFLRSEIFRILTSDRKVIFLAVAATIPAAVAGVLLEDVIEGLFTGNMTILGACFFLTGIILAAGHFLSKERHAGPSEAGFWRCMAIGAAQAVAIFPGVSRSGSTVSAGLLAGFTRESAVRFSFLLSIPIILGASGKKILTDFDKLGSAGEPINLMTAGVVCFGFSLLAQHAVMKAVRGGMMGWFAAYCAVLGAAVAASGAFGLF